MYLRTYLLRTVPLPLRFERLWCKFNKKNMADITGRTVVGKDIVVTYLQWTDQVSIKHILDSGGINGRYTPQLLIESLGFTSQTATMQFVKNNNLHNGGKALQGALLLINFRIGLIVKSVGSYILFQTLLPRRLSGFKIINLMRSNRQFGFFLQQIRGPRLGILSSLRHGGNQSELEPHPYIIDGYVYMSPFGPDFYVTIPTENIPPSVNGEFDSYLDNLSSTCFLKTSHRIKNLRKSQKGNVLYVCADAKSLVNLDKSADMFYIPVGIAREDDVKRPWKSLDGRLDGRLYKHQDFIVVTKEKLNEIKQWGKLSDSEWSRRLWAMCGKKRSNLTNLIVPTVDWSLNIVLVPQKCLDEIYDSLTAKEKVFARLGEGKRKVEMIFVQERKSVTKTRGISISSWVLGDTQVSRTRVTYPYVTAYKKTYGTGYGSRVRSQCLDSVNSYRDKRLNPRAHPSPLIHDSEIGEHQYFSHHKQRSCLLQMKLEMVLHNLTTNITLVAERMNPDVVQVVSGLSTKFIATTGQSLYSFCNGLHADTCDKISSELKVELFPKPTEEIQRMLSLENCCFPTTCGYQHVWKNKDDATKYGIQHYFVMPTLGLAVSLDDSICHHFQGGVFAHCTSVCVLQECIGDEQTGDDDIIYSISNDDDMFRVFAWGSSANSRTVRANIARANELGRHRERTDEQRRDAAERRATASAPVPAPSAAPSVSARSQPAPSAKATASADQRSTAQRSQPAPSAPATAAAQSTAQLSQPVPNATATASAGQRSTAQRSQPAPSAPAKASAQLTAQRSQPAPSDTAMASADQRSKPAPSAPATASAQSTAQRSQPGPSPAPSTTQAATAQTATAPAQSTAPARAPAPSTTQAATAQTAATAPTAPATAPSRTTAQAATAPARAPAPSTTQAATAQPATAPAQSTAQAATAPATSPSQSTTQAVTAPPTATTRLTARGATAPATAPPTSTAQSARAQAMASSRSTAQKERTPLTATAKSTAQPATTQTAVAPATSTAPSMASSRSTAQERRAPSTATAKSTAQPATTQMTKAPPASTAQAARTPAMAPSRSNAQAVTASPTAPTPVPPSANTDVTAPVANTTAVHGAGIANTTAAHGAGIGISAGSGLAGVGKPEVGRTDQDDNDNDGGSEYDFRFEDDSYEEEEPRNKKSRWFP